MTAPRVQLDCLTGVRGIAAWFVVFYHIRTGLADTLGPVTTAFLAKGYLAVDLFFMLSGFVIWLNYAASFEVRGMAAYHDFLKRRLARIYPLHLFVLVATMLLAATMTLTGRADPVRYPWSELPLHLALLQNWGFTTELSWNHPAWSISTEFAAYLAFPLLVIGLRLGRWPVLALCSGIVALCFGLHLVMASWGAPTLGVDIPRFGLLRCLIEFACGAMLCRVWMMWRARGAVVAPLATVAAALAALGWAIGAIAETLAFPLLIASLLLALALGGERRWNPLCSRPIVWLGEISYSTYLIHFGGWTLFKLALVRDASHVPLWQAGLFLALILGGSILSYRFVEQPGRKWVSARKWAFAAKDSVRPA